MKIFKVESFKKGIAASSLTNLFIKLVSFANTVLLAYYFGTNSEIDIYFYCMGVISLFAMFLTGFSSSVIIPESIRLREQIGIKESIHFINSFIYIFAVISLALTMFFYINPIKIFTFFSKFEYEKLSQGHNILFMSIPFLFFIVMTSFLSDVLTSFKLFSLPLAINLLNSISSICFIVAFHSSFGMNSVLLGLFFSYSINMILLLVILKKQLSWSFTFKKISFQKNVVENIAYSQIGNISTFFVGYIPIYLLSGFRNGIIASLNYGKQVSEIPTYLILNQFSAIVGIKFSELNAKKDFTHMNKVFLNSTYIIIFLLIPISLSVFFFSKEIITLFFRRGSFSNQSVQQSALFLQYFIISLSLIGVDTISARLLMATQKIKQAFFYQICMNIIQIIVLFSFISALKEMVFPISILVKYVVNLFAMYYLLKYLAPYIQYKNTILYFIKILFLNTIVFIPVFYLGEHIITCNLIARKIILEIVYLLILFVLSIYYNINQDFSLMIKKLVVRANLMFKRQGV